MSRTSRPYQLGISSMALIGVGLVLLALAFAYGLGGRHERDHQRALQLAQEREAAAGFAADVRLGNQVSTRHLEAERKARLYADQLTQERRHATLTLPAPDCLAPLARSDLRAPGATAPGLTADAVRLWNSALEGHDVPAGACSADGATGGACVADAGLTVADAWDNQAANALSCRVDRRRLTNLIDYLNQARN